MADESLMDELEAQASALSRFGFGEAVRPLFPLNFAAPVNGGEEAVCCRHHLNHASYGVAPLEVTAAARAQADAIEAWPDEWFRRTALPSWKEAAETVGRFLGAAPGALVFVDNATTAVNAVLGSLRLGPGDALLILDHTYRACANAARHTCERSGAELLTLDLPLPLPSDDALVGLLDSCLARHPRIRFVLLDHLTSPTSIVLPVRDMAAVCRARGVLVMVDGAHAPGQLPLQLADIGADWYTGNLHKWVFAPKGVAILHTAAERQATTQAAIVSHFYKLSYAERFFMQGTADHSRLMASPAALRFVEERLGGWDNVRAHNSALCAAGASLLVRAWRTRLLPVQDAAQAAPHMAVIEAPFGWRSFVQPPLPPDASEEEAARALAADSGFNERVSAAVLRGFGCQSQWFVWRVSGVPLLWVRISAQVYNTIGDYEALAVAGLELRRRVEQRAI